MKLALTLAAVAVILVGCGPRGKLPEEIVLEQEKKKEEKGPDQTVQLKGGNLERSDGKNQLWAIEWKEAQADFNLDAAKFGGRLKEVSGTISKEGKVVSSFIAREGVVKPGSRKLTLLGGIKLSSETYDASLQCNQLEYDADTGIVEASKGISLLASGNLFPNVGSLRAKADLSEVGSPETWKEMKNNPLSRLLMIGAASAVAGSTVIAQDEDGVLYRVSCAGKWGASTKRVDGNLRTTFTAESAPIIVNWFQQGIEISGKSVTALLTKDTKLINATMSGGIRFKASKQKTDTISISAPSASYTDADQKLVVNGALELDRKMADGGTMHAEGSGGTVYLDREAKGDKLIKSAVISGRIVFKMSGTRIDSETKKPAAYHVNASAGKLTYNEADRKVTLEDGVQISGNDPSLYSTMKNISKVTLVLTESREIDTIELEGNPGETIFEQKKTTGGGGGGKKRK